MYKEDAGIKAHCIRFDTFLFYCQNLAGRWIERFFKIYSTSLRNPIQLNKDDSSIPLFPLSLYTKQNNSLTLSSLSSSWSFSISQCFVPNKDREPFLLVHKVLDFSSSTSRVFSNQTISRHMFHLETIQTPKPSLLQLQFLDIYQNGDPGNRSSRSSGSRLSRSCSPGDCTCGVFFEMLGRLYGK